MPAVGLMSCHLFQLVVRNTEQKRVDSSHHLKEEYSLIIKHLPKTELRKLKLSASLRFRFSSGSARLSYV